VLPFGASKFIAYVCSNRFCMSCYCRCSLICKRTYPGYRRPFSLTILAIICSPVMNVSVLTRVSLTRCLCSMRALGLIQEDEYMVGRKYFDAKQETRIVLRRQAPWVVRWCLCLLLDELWNWHNSNVFVNEESGLPFVYMSDWAFLYTSLKTWGSYDVSRLLFCSANQLWWSF
jgi:hypothetical protein